MEALLVIDAQKGFLNERLGERNNPKAEENILKLLKFFRENKRKIIHIQHISTDKNGILYKESDIEFMDSFEPLNDELVFQKNVNSAFIGTNLDFYLKESQIKKLVIVGFTLPHCVSTTTRMASNLGYEVTLIEDATVSFEMTDISSENILKAEEVHRYQLAALNKEFANIIKTDSFLKNNI